MILLAIIKLPYNLLIEFIRYCDKIENKNKGYIKHIYNEMKDRFK
jgi:hypothetical protein